MAALFAEEIAEAIRYLEDPNFYVGGEEIYRKGAGKIWLGAAEDTVFRKRGVEFVDGTAPGFAAIVGAAPSVPEASGPGEEYQKKNLYVLCAANQNGTTSSRAAPGSRRADRLEYPAGALRTGYLRGGLCPGFRQPGGHGLRRDQARATIKKCSCTTRTGSSPLSMPCARCPPNGRPMPPAASTGASRPSPTRTSRKYCPPGSAPMNTWSAMCP